MASTLLLKHPQTVVVITLITIRVLVQLFNGFCRCKILCQIILVCISMFFCKTLLLNFLHFFPTVACFLIETLYSCKLASCLQLNFCTSSVSLASTFAIFMSPDAFKAIEQAKTFSAFKNRAVSP